MARKFVLAAATGILGFVLFAPGVRADDYTWIGTTGAWSDPANWDQPTPPTSGDDAHINNGGVAQISSSAEACALLYLGEAGGENGTAELSGGALTAQGARVGLAGAGVFTQTGGEFTYKGNIRLGNDVGSTGTYNLSGDGLLHSSGPWLVVGYHGTGTFNQSGGTVSGTDRVYIGEDTDSIGTYNLSAGAIETGIEHIGVYSGGSGAFTQSGGTHTVFSDLYIGDGGGSQGSYMLSGTGELTTINEYVAKFGAGSFTQTGGTHTISNYLFVGSQAGSSGSFTLGGTGQLNTYEGNVGHYGVGLFTQSGGTHTVTNALRIGRYAGAIGTYSLSGGSLSADYLYVGVAGSGTFDLADAAAEVTLTTLLRFGTYSNFTTVPDTTIHLVGASFENHNADEAELAGLANVNLIFEGGGTRYAKLEVAGEDKGEMPGGYIDNFELGTLTIGENTRVRLVDDTNNGNRGGAAGSDEAIYVDALILEAGAILDLNYLNLYWGGTFVNNGGIVLHGEGTCADAGDCPPEEPFCVDNYCVECEGDAHCGPGTVCVDGQCVRQGLRNPLGTVDSEMRRPVRRDDEMFLAGLSTTADQTELAIGRDGHAAEWETTREAQLVVAGESGRILGPTPEQAALVFKAPTGNDRTLEIVNLFADGLPTLATYSFTPANPDSRIDLAVADLDFVREPFPSLEYHDEVFLVYEVDDEGTRYALLTILSYEDVEPDCGLVDPKPGPTRVFTRRLATPLKYQDGTPNHMAVAIGDFDDDSIREIAVAVADSTGVVVVELFTLETDAFGETFIGGFSAPTSSDCCRARTDEHGCEASACEDAVCDDDSQCCFPPGFPLYGGWKQDCADFAWESGDCGCGVIRVIPGFSTGVIADHFEIIVAENLDTNPARIYDGPGEDAWTVGDQLAIAGINTTTYGGLPFLYMEVWGYDDVAGFTRGIEDKAHQWALGAFGGVSALPDSTVRLATIPYYDWQSCNPDESLVVLIDTQRGPAVELFIFDGEDSSCNSQLYSVSPDWPSNIASQPATPAPTGANITVGNFVQYRSNLGDRETLLISDPQTTYTSERPGKLVQLGFNQWQPDYGSMQPITPFVISGTGELVPVDTVPVLLSVDVDGDNGYYVKQGSGGAILYLGEPTLFSFTGLETMDLILAEPPKHVDYLRSLGGIVNISQGDAFYTQFSSAEQQEETASKETRTDFTSSTSHSYSVSTEASVGLFGIGGSVESSVGQTFEDTHSESNANFHSDTSTITLTQVSRSERDDQLAFKEQIVDLWRYPVMGVVVVDGEGDPVPDDEQPVNPFFDLTIPGPVYNVFGPGKLNDAYQPYHMNGNILSYPVFSAGTFEPPDVGVFEYGDMVGDDFVAAGSSDQPIWAENAFVVGGLAAEQSLNFSNTVKNSTTVSVADTHKTSLDVSVKATVSGSYGICSGSVSSEYKYNASNSHSFSDTRSASRTNSTSVEIAVNIPSNIPAERGYKFFPAWYTTPGGAYKVTHAVSTTEIGEAARLFWEGTYMLPDPSLNLPHRIVADADIFGHTYYRLGSDLSRKKAKGFFIHDLDGNELFAPPYEGDLLQLDLRVYNLSVASSVCDLTVRFEAQEYLFGQETGPRIQIGEEYIPYIPARGEAPPCPTLCRADIDEDLDCDEDDLQDFIAILLNGEPCKVNPFCCVGDMNDDDAVDGLDIEGFVGAMLVPHVDVGEDELDPGAPENMRYARVVWDTTDFGPTSGTGLRSWLIYATLDPLNEIPNETHELEDRYGDPLRDYLGQPIDPLPGGAPGTYLEKGQNNTGWTSVSVAPPHVEAPPVCEAAGGRGAPRSGSGRPDVYLAPRSLVVVDPATGAETVGEAEVYANEPVTCRLVISSDMTCLRNCMLEVYEDSPGKARRLLVRRTIMGIDAANGAYEYFTWQPIRADTYTLVAEVVEPLDDQNPGNATATLEINVARTRAKTR
ncbi:MAG: hypothetical protein ABII12_17730 [Planctomycetota bacterium]